MKKFEYMILFIKIFDLWGEGINKLNELGNEGWELLYINSQPSLENIDLTAVVLLKREI